MLPNKRKTTEKKLTQEIEPHNSKKSNSVALSITSQRTYNDTQIVNKQTRLSTCDSLQIFNTVTMIVIWNCELNVRSFTG